MKEWDTDGDCDYFGTKDLMADVTGSGKYLFLCPGTIPAPR